MAGRNRVKKIIRRLAIAIFLGILIMPPAAWGICKLVGIKEPSLMNALDFDLGENREPASFPEELNLSSITSELEAYYNDHVPFRSVIITVNRRINSKLERAYSSQIQPVLVALMKNKHMVSNNAGDTSIPDGRPSEEVQTGEEGTSKEAFGENNTGEDALGENNEVWNTAGGNTNDGNAAGEGSATGKLPDGTVAEQSSGFADGEKEEGSNIADKADTHNADASYLPPREMNGTIFGRDDWMFCSYDNSIEYYRGSNIMTEQQMKDKLSLMQKLKQICDSKEIQLQFMIAPNKEQVYREYMPSYEVETTYKRAQRFVDFVRQNSEVKIIYPLDELRDARNNMSTYYKYDTHWNHYGSFIATCALYEDMELELADLTGMEIQDGACIWGLVITAGLSWQDYDRDYDHIPQYKPEVQILETDGEIDVIHTEKSAVYRSKSTAERVCNFVMVGDSFRLYMVPYLERDFNNVSIAHRDNIGDIQSDILAADILVIECVERLDDSLNGTLLELIEILGEEG